MNTVDVLVIGGGISGLSLLHCLERQGLKTECWEADQRLGGKIQSHRSGGYLTEAAATMVMNFRPEVSRFLQATQIAAHRHPRNLQASGQRYLLRNETLHAVPATIPGLFMSPLFSARGKRHLFREWLIPAGGGPEESAAEFVRRRLGDEVLSQAMEPFIAGTLAGNADQSNAYSVLPRLTALERKYGSITAGVLVHKLLGKQTARVGEVFSFSGGMGELVARLSNACRAPILTGIRARELRYESGLWRIIGESGNGSIGHRARQVVLCCPAYCAAMLVRRTDSELARWLSSIAYAPVTIAHTGFSADAVGADLDGTGFLVPRGENLGINGNLWPSSLFKQRAPAGKVLLSTYLGGARHPEHAALDHHDTLSQVMADLEGPLRLKGDPEMVRLDRHQRALPLYHGNYFALSQAIKKRAARIGGLHLLGNYLDGVSVRDRILQAQLAAGCIARTLDRRAISRRRPLGVRQIWSST